MRPRKDIALVGALVWLLALIAGAIDGGKTSALLVVVDVPPDHNPVMGYLPVVAIDLGNTNSCVAGYETGEMNTMFHHCIPSWVAFTDDGAVLTGEDARNYAAVNPGAAVSGFKRLLGKRFSRGGAYEPGFAERVEENLPYKVVEKNVQLHAEVKGGAVSVEQLTATVLAKLKETAEAHLGCRVHGAILTLPLRFSDDASTSAAVFAGVVAGLGVGTTRVLSEPVAAAIAYGLSENLRDEGNVVVLHVGGGTAEASVLTFVDGEFETLSGQYDPFFGGQDFDRRIMDHFVKLVKDKHGKDITGDGAALDRLRTACERAKKALSQQDHARVTVESLVDEPLTRAEFEDLNHDLFLKVVEMVDTAVSRAEVDTNTIDEVLLIGGSTMIPKVRELISDYFGGTKAVRIHTKLKPDEVVTTGAAQFSKREDALPRSLYWSSTLMN